MMTEVMSVKDRTIRPKMNRKSICQRGKVNKPRANSRKIIGKICKIQAMSKSLEKSDNK
jgi:hypothetical protein